MNLERPERLVIAVGHDHCHVVLLAPHVRDKDGATVKVKTLVRP